MRPADGHAQVRNAIDSPAEPAVCTMLFSRIVASLSAQLREKTGTACRPYDRDRMKRSPSGGLRKRSVEMDDALRRSSRGPPPMTMTAAG